MTIFVLMRRTIIIFLLPILCILTLTNCGTDPCAEIDCMNEGRCLEGDCDCAEGFEGEYCELREIDKFIGTYVEGHGYCPIGNVVLNAHVISENPADHREIFIDDGTLDLPIKAVADGWNFVIPEQQNSWTDPNTGFVETMTLFGQGWLDLDQGLLVYQLDNNACRYELKLP